MLKNREAPNKTTGMIFLPHTQKHVGNHYKKNVALCITYEKHVLPELVIYFCRVHQLLFSLFTTPLFLFSPYYKRDLDVFKKYIHL